MAQSQTQLKRLSMHTQLCPTASHGKKTLLCWPGSQSRGLSLAGLDVRGLPDATSSASGPAGALPDITSSHTPSTWKDLGPVTTTATAPEPTSPDAIAASTTILPTGEQPEGGRAVLLAEVEPGLTAQKEATHPPSETSGLENRTFTHRVSVLVPHTAAPYKLTGRGPDISASVNPGTVKLRADT